MYEKTGEDPESLSGRRVVQNLVFLTALVIIFYSGWRGRGPFQYSISMAFC